MGLSSLRRASVSTRRWHDLLLEMRLGPIFSTSAAFSARFMVRSLVWRATLSSSTNQRSLGSGTTPCCGKTPFELPLTDRLTLDPQRVTCEPSSRCEITHPLEAALGEAGREPGS